MKPGYMTVPDAFFAGFFDADGYVGITPPIGTSIFLLTCRINQVSADVLMLFKERFGGKVGGPRQRAGNARPIYSWGVDAKRAEDFLAAVLPWLVVKRERASLALEFRNLFRGANILPRGRCLNEDKRVRIMAQRQELYDKMRMLNKRGVA